MFRKLAIGIVAAVLIALPASHASAGKKDNGKDGFIGVGANFTWDNYKKPILTYSGADISPGLSSLDYGSPNFGGAFHWGVTNKLVLTANLDFGFFTHTVYPYPGTGAANVSSYTINFWQLGVMLGVKYFFKDPEAGKVGLYVSAGVGKYFAGSTTNAKVKTNRDAMQKAFYEGDCVTYPSSCTADGNKYADDQLADAWDAYKNNAGAAAWEEAENSDLNGQERIDAELEMVGKLAAPLVAQIAVGAEFFATENFSIGADILGLRFAFAKADVGEVEGTDRFDGTGSWTGEQKYMNLYVYSGITMNFNLTGGGKSKPKEEEKKKEEPVDDGWGTPAPSGSTTESPTPSGSTTSSGGWGTSGGWSTGPAAPSKDATQPEPKPAPAGPTAPPVPGQPTDAPPPPPPAN